MGDRLANRSEIGHLLKMGKKHKEIGLILGVGPGVVAKVAGELGLQTRRNTQYVALELHIWEEIVQRYRAGETPTELAKEFGISRSSIYARAKK